MSNKKKSINDLLEEALVPEEEQPYEVPENWCFCRINSILKLRSGTTLTKNMMNKEGVIPVFGGNGITGFHDEYNIDEEKIVIGRVGFYCGSVHITPKKAWVTDNALIVKYPKELYNENFLYWMLKYLNLGQFSNSSAQPVISSKTLKPIKIVTPPLNEQTRIAKKIEHLFTKLDEAKRLIEEVKDSFELRWESVLSNAFRGKVTKKWRMENSKMEDAEHLYRRIQDLYKNRKNIEEDDKYGTGYDIPKSWKWVRLGNIVQINPPRKKLTDLADELECTFIPMPAVSDKTGQITQPEVRPLSKVRKGYTFFLEGDILFAKITPCMENGKTAIAQDLKNGFGFGSTEFHVVRPNQYINTKLLYYLLRSKQFRTQAKNAMTGAVGQQRVPKVYLENYYFPLPPREEQDKIVELLDKLYSNEMSITELANLEEKIEFIRQSILAKAFRGELGTNDPTDGHAIEILKETLELKEAK